MRKLAFTLAALLLIGGDVMAGKLSRSLLDSRLRS